jgi:hypothetical protein
MALTNDLHSNLTFLQVELQKAAEREAASLRWARSLGVARASHSELLDAYRSVQTARDRKESLEAALAALTAAQQATGSTRVNTSRA